MKPVVDPRQRDRWARLRFSISVAITLPAGLTATKLEGSGWNCNLPTLICTHFVPLSGNASYPPITLKVPRGRLDTNGQAHPAIGVSVNGENDVNLANNAASLTVTRGSVTPQILLLLD